MAENSMYPVDFQRIWSMKMDECLIAACESIIDNRKKVDADAAPPCQSSSMIVQGMEAIASLRASSLDGIRAKAAVYLLIATDALAESIARDVVGLSAG